MKKLIKMALVMMLAAPLFTSCSGFNKGNDEDANASESRLRELNDSLRTVIEEKDAVMDLMNDVAETMTNLRQLENLASSPTMGDTPDQRKRIKSDLDALQMALRDRSDRIAALESRLLKSNKSSQEMVAMIERLKQQVQDQESQIATLTASLDMANATISTLNTRVDSLKVENTTAHNNTNEARAESERLRNELNTCYYALGSKKELKKNKIIESGFLRKTKVMEGDMELAYFTKADKRTLKEINLHAKNAKVLSNHPADSYVIKGEGDNKILVITNATRFWERSNFLIVQL